MADLAYSYAFTLERLKADASRDTKDVVVYQNKRALVPGVVPVYELTIPSASLPGPGRWAAARPCAQRTAEL